jgi:hypothetical protein
MIYNELTRRHFEDPAAAGELSGPGVRRGAAGSRRDGTWVQFDVKFAGHDGPMVVEEARFQAFGCPHVIGVCDWVATTAAGAPATGGLPETVAALQRRFEVPVEKLGRLLIVEDAWIAALGPPC